jgi:hypothetical protein
MYRTICLTNRKPFVAGSLEFCRTMANEKNTEAGYVKFIVEPFAVPDCFNLTCKDNKISQEQVLQKDRCVPPLILDAQIIYPDERGLNADNPFDEEEYYQRFYSTEFDNGQLPKNFSVLTSKSVEINVKEKVTQYLKHTQMM